MAENFSLAELVIPGTYVRVRSEGLISAGGISTGNIGIVGTAANGLGETELFSDFAAARNHFTADPVDGAEQLPYDPYADGAGTLNLNRALQVLFANGARNVYAHGLAAGANRAAFQSAFDLVAQEDVNILIAPELSTTDALAILGPVLERRENEGRDMIAVVGSDQAAAADIAGQAPTDDRILLTAPGFQMFDVATPDPANGDRPGRIVTLNGRYSAAAVAGLLATLTPQSSPTNQRLTGVTTLATRFNGGQFRQLVQGRVLVLEQRSGTDVRVVRGVTTDDGAYRQVTTRRIVDFAKAGIRAASDPFIGRLNNARVRGALRAAIDGFLATMLVDEQLTEYQVEVTATRADEIAGRAIVNVLLQPTFSIDFIAVTINLQ